MAYYAGQNPISRDTIVQMMEDLEMPPGVHYQGTRPEFARAWRELYHPDEVADEEGMCLLPPDDGLAAVASSDLRRRTGILIAGSAGQKIRSIATLLGAGGILSGLHATQKDDYPITVRTGHSAAEVILSPEPIGYTGIEMPDIVLILSVDGLVHVKKQLPTYPPETRVYIDSALGEIDTAAQVIRLPLAEAAKTVHRLAIGAVGLGAILAAEGLYPREAFDIAARRLQKAKVADTNVAGFAAGFDLTGC